MARTLTSHLKRWMLWRRAGGRCQKCGEALGRKWHAHHKYPWTLTHRTHLDEMMAVCASCNLKMGDRMDFFDESALRPGQRVALRTIQSRISEGHTHTAIVMATRYGKSDLQRIATMVAIELRLACCAISLSPTDYLTDQMVSEKKWKPFCKRIKLQRSPKYARISACVMELTANGEHFLSTTMGFFIANKKYFIDEANALRRRTGLPVILFVDECHTQSTSNVWGAAVTSWQKATNGHVVLLTATTDRADEDRIPGFEYTEIDRKDVIVTKTRPGSKPEKIRIEQFSAFESKLKIVPHEQIGFDQAWDEGVLCQVEYLPFDINLDVVLGSATTKGMLSTISNAAEVRRALSSAIRHQVVIQDGCKMALDRLRSFRAVDPTCGMIIFSGNDQQRQQSSGNGEFNQHAQQIKRAIRALAPSLRVLIATSKNEGRDELDAFADGTGDVLIVKNMGALGLDISRLKIVLDLSPTRTTTAVIQRIMRVATPHDIPSKQAMLLRCAWVTPFDLLSQAIYQRVIASNGGQATVSDLELLRSYEKDREQGPQRPEYIATGTHGVGASDTLRNTATQSELDELSRFLNLVPEAGAFVTQPELVRRHQAASQPQPQPAATPQNTNAQIQQLVDEINNLANQVTKSRMRGQAYTQKRWEVLMKDIWNSAKQAAGIHLSYTLKQVSSIQTLTRLRDIFLEMLHDND